MGAPTTKRLEELRGAAASRRANAEALRARAAREGDQLLIEAAKELFLANGYDQDAAAEERRLEELHGPALAAKQLAQSAAVVEANERMAIASENAAVASADAARWAKWAAVFTAVAAIATLAASAAQCRATPLSAQAVPPAARPAK